MDMAKEEIIAGLKNAVSRGESVQQASQSFINAGYNSQEVMAAAAEVQQQIGITGYMAQAPSQPLQSQPQMMPQEAGMPALPALSVASAAPMPATAMQMPNEAPSSETKKPFPLKIALISAILIALLGVLGIILWKNYF